MTDIGIPPRSKQDWDVPVADVEARCQVLRDAFKATHSPSDQIAYAGDLFLIAHPEACTTDASYPGWAKRLAELIAKSDSTRTERTRGGAS
ncbi:hypothetical protein [Streptomyces sp. NPDC051994]|uniref:hypothetical protein n=1 Tax=unclassified Streptomyces TaxID=2593676 RepID=UPI003435C537